MSAWFEGDFDRCLSLCDAVRARDAETQTHLALLRTRALLRLRRLDEAAHALTTVQPHAQRSDEAITALMLAGEITVRRGEPDAGLESLSAAQAAAAGAHRTIRSEIALNIGLAHYCRHDFAAADRALRTVATDADLVHARAVQYRAWVAFARGDTERAARMFVRALETLDACVHGDRYFETNCLRALAHLALERLDAHAWEFMRARRDRLDWSSSALAEPRFFIAYCAASYEREVLGDVLGAMRESRAAEAFAPAGAFHVQALCRRATVARQAGEAFGHRDHAEAAAEAFGALPAAALTGDEQTVPLVLAEELAGVNLDSARSLLALHRRLAPMLPQRLMSQSALAEAYRVLVEAGVEEHGGRGDRALALYREAFAAYDRIGYQRRAVHAALAIWRLSGDRKAFGYAVAVTSHLPSRSFLRREVEAAQARGLRLTAVQREVLTMICAGKSNPEIARLRNRSLHTVRNLVARLFEIFEVGSREQLAVQCVRLGLVSD